MCIRTLVPRGDRIRLCGKICQRGPVQKGRWFLAINWIFDVSIRFLRVLGLFPSGNPRVMLQIPGNSYKGHTFRWMGSYRELLRLMCISMRW